MPPASAPSGNRSLRPASLWPGALLALATFALLLLYWAIWIHDSYFPVGDEFSLIVHSTRFFHPSATDWFRHGFAGYFEPYPDLSIPYSNFLRPVANLMYFVQSFPFGRHWSDYLLGNYAIIASTVMVVWYLARRGLGQPGSVAALVAVGSAVSPAVSYQAIFRPSFAFDLLGALWALLTLACLLRRRWAVAGLFVALAVLTKETAYYTSLAAAGTAYLLLAPLPRLARAARAGLFLVPLLLVTALRRVDFPGRGSGVYVLNQTGDGGAVKRVVLALTHWPYLLPGEQHIFERSLHNVSALLLTAACWVLLLLFAAATIRRFRGTYGASDATASTPQVPPGSTSDEAHAALLLFLALSLLLPIALDLSPRFGASVFPLTFLAFGSVAAGSSRRVARIAALSLLVILTGLSAYSLLNSLLGSQLHREQHLWARSRKLVQLLAAETQPTVFLIADASESFSSPSNVQRFAGYAGSVVPLSNLDATECPAGALQLTLKRPGMYQVHSLAPGSCGGNSLGATYRLTPQPVHQFTRELPAAEVVYDAHGGGWRDGQFSARELDLQLIPHVPAYAIVLPRAEGAADLQVIQSTAPPKQ